MAWTMRKRSAFEASAFEAFRRTLNFADTAEQGLMHYLAKTCVTKVAGLTDLQRTYPIRCCQHFEQEWWRQSCLRCADAGTGALQGLGALSPPCTHLSCWGWRLGWPYPSCLCPLSAPVMPRADSYLHDFFQTAKTFAIMKQIWCLMAGHDAVQQPMLPTQSLAPTHTTPELK